MYCTEYPSEEPTASPTGIIGCSSSPCDCDSSSSGFEDPLCVLCHSGTGCAACASGAILIDPDYPCTPCDSGLVGDGCINCQNLNGCVQCSTGYNLVEDEIAPNITIGVCKPIPVLAPTVVPGTNTCDDGILPCPSINCAGSGDNPHCAGQQPWGCSNCHGGYFFKDYSYPCVACSTINGCNACTSWQGCTNCDGGYSLYFDSECGIYRCNLTTPLP